MKSARPTPRTELDGEMAEGNTVRNSERKLGRRWLIGLTILVFLVCIGGAWLILDPDSPLNRADALKSTYEWARLSPLPKSATAVRIEITGNMFTRGFEVSFSASPSDIQTWLNDSPGTRESIPELQKDGTILYNITPGGGATFAEVRLSKDKRTVRIRTYWS